MDDIYNLYIKAWENYEDEMLMSVINTYFRKILSGFEIKCLNDFHNNYGITVSDEDTYQIHKYGEPDKAVWEGENLTGEVIRKIVEGE